MTDETSQHPEPPPDEPDADLFPKLHPRIETWIKEKMKTYHARKASSKPTQQYGASLRYVAGERQDVCAQNHIERDKAVDIVIGSLGKTGAVFQALLVQALREREAQILAERKQREIELGAERDVAMAKAEAQAAQLASQKEESAQMRAMFTSMGELMQRISGQLETVTKQLQITYERRDDSPRT